MANFFKNALLGTLVGVISGPLLAGISGFLTLSLIWFGMWLGQQLDYSPGEILGWAGVFAVLIAPFGGSVGAIIGLIVGTFGRGFGSLFNAGSFGAIIGSIIGLFAAVSLFGAIEDISSMAATLLALTFTGIGTAIIIKKIQWSRQKASPAG